MPGSLVGGRPVLAKASELRMLDIINLTDGRRLGSLYDLDIDMATGRVRALIVPGESGLLGMTHGGEIEIPWSRVRKIGVDVILVEMPELGQGVAPQAGGPSVV